MKFINTLEENGGGWGRGEKSGSGVVAESHPGPGACVGVRVCVGWGGLEGRREAQTGPVNQELRPLGGAEAGQACVWWWGGLEL